MKNFLRGGKAPVTAMIMEETAESAMEKIRTALDEGADAFGVQLECLRKEECTEENIRKIYAACAGFPIYTTSYRNRYGADRTDEECVELLLLGARCGADVCDVMGDMFCRTEGELTDNAEAVEKQRKLVEEIHSLGSQVLMSSHTHVYTPSDVVLRTAHAHADRGADISKIVTGAFNEVQLAEDIAIMERLKAETDIPFLFLANGEYSRLIRQFGPKFGSCMILSRTYENEEQPMISLAKHLRDAY